MLETNIKELKNLDVRIYCAKAPEMKDIPRWKKTVIAVERLGFFVPAGMFDDEDKIEEQCKLERAGFIRLNHHLYADMDWLRKCYHKNKMAVAVIDSIEQSFIDKFVPEYDA